MTSPAHIIARKRDGEELSEGQIEDFVRQYTDDVIPDYQMAAFAMAVHFQGMTSRETLALTRACLQSGTALSWPDSVTPADKHSTGGIGDKTSLVVAPVLACCGLHVPMLSGRGLGITGGTLDKLESIPGFRTDLTIKEIQDQTARIGCVITGATPELAPADRKLYALRDVTATVPAQPLIVASIMSKKLAEGLDSLVLDVKFGSGAFMKTLPSAQSLARALVDIGKQMRVRTTALVSDMNEPLGWAAGNAIEVREAMRVLSGGGPTDVLELSVRLGCELLLAEGIAHSEQEAHRLQLASIRDGRALRKFEELVEAQGGELGRFELPEATDMLSPKAGCIQSIDTAQLGHVIVELGGGRRLMGDLVDHGVGLEVPVRVGDQVDQGQLLARVYAREDVDAAKLLGAFRIDDRPVEKRTLVHDRIE